MVTHRDPGNGPEDRTPRTGQLTATTQPESLTEQGWRWRAAQAPRPARWLSLLNASNAGLPGAVRMRVMVA